MARSVPLKSAARSKTWKRAACVSSAPQLSGSARDSKGSPTHANHTVRVRVRVRVRARARAWVTVRVRVRANLTLTITLTISPNPNVRKPRQRRALGVVEVPQHVALQVARRPEQELRRVALALVRVRVIGLGL